MYLMKKGGPEAAPPFFHVRPFESEQSHNETTSKPISADRIPEKSHTAFNILFAGGAGTTSH